MLTYARNIRDTVMTTLKGMQITLRNLRRPETTVQYPEEQCEIKPGYRGFHTLDQEICILCFQCAKICPVDCIEMAATRVEKKFLSWEQFTVDYNKCLFCDLCVEVCPVDCIHMDRKTGPSQYAVITDDRTTLNIDLLIYRGLSETGVKAVDKLRADKAAAAAKPAPAPAAPPSAPAAPRTTEGA